MSAEGTPAERFAIEHAHYTEDLPFWRALADQVDGPVLDLGAAAGRVSCDLAAHGHEVVAVDHDPAMVAEIDRAARAADVAARVTTVCADIRLLTLGRTFALVLMPMNTMQAFLTRSDQLAVLGAVRAHLADDAEFVFDLVLADTYELAAAVGTVMPGAIHRTPEALLRHAARFDEVHADTGTVRFTLLIDEEREEATQHFERPHTVHLYEPSEVWDLISVSGMEVRAVYGDFTGAPLAPDGERQIYRCGVAP